MIFNFVVNNLLWLYYLGASLMFFHSLFDFLKIKNAESRKDLPKHWQHKPDEVEDETFEVANFYLNAMPKDRAVTVLTIMSLFMGLLWFITIFYNIGLYWKHYRYKRGLHKGR